MFTKRKDAFTLVELLVVIAIIGVISGAITATFGNTREKAKDSIVKQSLASIRNVAEEVYYQTYPNSYLPVCFDTMVDLIIRDIDDLDGAVELEYQCLSTNDAWIAIFPLNDGGYWCSDGLGRSMPVDGFIEYSSEEYMDCTIAVAEDPETENPPTGGGSASPVLTLIGNTTVEIWSPSKNPFKGGAWHKYHEPGFTATDAEDGDLTAEVVVNGPNLIQTYGPKSCKVSEYEIYYSVTDSDGNSDGPDTRYVTHHKCHGP